MKPIAIDFEASGLDYYSPDFAVISAAFTWEGDNGEFKQLYVEGQEAVGDALKRVVDKGNPIVVHNLTYELGVILNVYPELEIDIDRFWDTKRLIQVTDGGMILKKPKPAWMKPGLSLVACASRHLPPKYHDHKEPFYEWIRDNLGVLKGKEGESLGKLPRSLLKAYNTADTDITLLLFNTTMRKFKQDGYTGYELDHSLYRFRCLQLVKAESYGVLTDKKGLIVTIKSLKEELDMIEEDFTLKMLPEIEKVIQMKKDLYLTEPLKSESGYRKRFERLESGDIEFEFNINSPKDLYWLYHHVMGIEAPFTTRPNKDGNGGGNPSFAKAHLGAWHSSGEILQNKGTLKIALKQSESLLALSSKDGRWHISMNSTGTKTSRLSGSDGSQ